MPGPSRRAVLTGLAAAALVPACGWEAGPRPDDTWAPETPVDDENFPSGLRVGDPTESGAVVGLITAATGVRLRWARYTERGWREEGELDVQTRDGAVHQEIEGLQADTSYAVIATAGAGRSAAARFRTAPPAGTARILRFGATSCLGGNAPWPSLSRAAGRDLDAFFLLGDTIYNDWGPPTGPRSKWEAALATQGLRDVAASCALVATWDDHEVRNNWDAERDAELAAECRVEFERALPLRPGPTGGIWRRLSFGDTADVFVLDCRSERTGGRYVSDAQLAWLAEGVASSAARFKIVLNSVPITDFSWIPQYGDLEADDRWQGFPAQREELLAVIRGVPGVLFLTGDFHVGGLTTIEDGGLFEVLCGPGGSPIHDLYALVPETPRTPRIVRDWNTVVLTLRPEAGEAEVVWVGDDDDALAREILTL